jgi:hypothetical protein
LIRIVAVSAATGGTRDSIRRRPTSHWDGREPVRDRVESKRSNWLDGPVLGRREVRGEALPRGCAQRCDDGRGRRVRGLGVTGRGKQEAQDRAVLDGRRADSGYGRVDCRPGDERGGEAGPGEGELGGNVGGDVAGRGREARLVAGPQDRLSPVRGRNSRPLRDQRGSGEVAPHLPGSENVQSIQNSLPSMSSIGMHDSFSSSA